MYLASSRKNADPRESMNGEALDRERGQKRQFRGTQSRARLQQHLTGRDIGADRSNKIQ